MFENIKLLWQRNARSLFRQPAGGCTPVLLLRDHCPSSSLLCLLWLMLQWNMDSIFVLLLCIPKGTRTFGLVISWLYIYSSPPEALVISPSSSSPLFPIKVIRRPGKGRPEIRRVKPKWFHLQCMCQLHLSVAAMLNAASQLLSLTFPGPGASHSALLIAVCLCVSVQ